MRSVLPNPYYEKSMSAPLQHISDLFYFKKMYDLKDPPTKSAWAVIFPVCENKMPCYKDRVSNGIQMCFV